MSKLLNKYKEIPILLLHNSKNMCQGFLIPKNSNEERRTSLLLGTSLISSHFLENRTRGPKTLVLLTEISNEKC